MTLNKQIIYVTGLPRSGSTLLCQLLGHHPDIYSIGHSSPLSQLLEKIRDFTTESPFLLSQLDVDFDLVYSRMLNGYRGYLNGWFDETDQIFVVDKNRHWVSMIETLNLIDPNFKMLVCLRDLVDVFGSIESQHQKTLLLRFPDRTSPNLHYSRLDTLFKDDGVIGSPLRGIQNLQYITDEKIKDRICYIEFDALVKKSVDVMKSIYQWLDIPHFAFDPNDLEVKPHETDSYYRFKYRHNTYPTIKPSTKHTVSDLIKNNIYKEYAWYYQTFFPVKYEAFTRNGKWT
ncbi:MAG: sulfotransferase [Thiomargarita sp.]|nr:sulfotransferase [Thiomargarita sp.]